MEAKQSAVYNMAVAFIQFREAYKQLVTAADAMGDDYDISDNYPFYLLDICEIRGAVDQWCIIQADRLLQQLPDIVPNPRCVSCEHVQKVRNANGSCKYAIAKECDSFPIVPFSVQLCSPILVRNGYDISNMSAAAIELLYLKMCNKRGILV